MPDNTAEVFTDGSCHTQRRIGGWAAIIFINGGKVILSGSETDTTHNRMELTAVIRSIEYIQQQHPDITAINITSDSQYVVGLKDRKENLSAKDFITKKGNDIQNIDLVRRLLSLQESVHVTITKIRAHQEKTEATQYNIEADKLSRNIVRSLVGK